jgi:hypothetical protein
MKKALRNFLFKIVEIYLSLIGSLAAIGAEIPAKVAITVGTSHINSYDEFKYTGY